MSNIQVTKIITVNGYVDADGNKIPMIFGPTSEDQVLPDEVCLEAVREQVPSVANVHDISWTTTYDNAGNKILRAEMTPRAQTKGC